MRRSQEIFVAMIKNHLARHAALGTVTRLVQAVRVSQVCFGGSGNAVMCG